MVHCSLVWQGHLVQCVALRCVAARIHSHQDLKWRYNCALGYFNTACVAQCLQLLDADAALEVLNAASSALSSPVSHQLDTSHCMTGQGGTAS